MRFITIAAVASSLVSTVYGFCAADPGSHEHVLAVEEQFRSQLQNATHNALEKRAASVGIYWNVFYDQNTGEGGYPDSVITQTLNVVNGIFAPSGLSFYILGVRRIATTYAIIHGAALNNAVERQIKSARQGNVQTLNIYTVSTNPNYAYAGWSTFPADFNSNPQADGIMYDYNYLPVRAFNNFNSGRVMAHEIGHWVGLYHTFQDGCNGGDFVDDTPAEASAASGCPRGRDTCLAPGADPIENMMDYSDDTCRIGFTNGQIARFRGQMSYYRGINI